MKQSNTIQQLSAHLFWDTHQNNINVDKDAAFIIKRCLEYGLLSDWLIIKGYYGLPTIIQVAQQLRSLDDKAFNFIQTLSNCPKHSFRCYIAKPLVLGHWV